MLIWRRLCLFERRELTLTLASCRFPPPVRAMCHPTEKPDGSPPSNHTTCGSHVSRPGVYPSTQSLGGHQVEVTLCARGELVISGAREWVVGVGVDIVRIGRQRDQQLTTGRGGGGEGWSDLTARRQRQEGSQQPLFSSTAASHQPRARRWQPR